ncbi:MAG: TIGR02281 family clan AA aspartic protease [Candidatus Scalindua sp.]|nr:TIGR02281 family clan AA aspartic protease [Candidatus Scalindua sp.]
MEIGKYIISKTALLALFVCMAAATNVYSAPRIKYSGMVYDRACIWVDGRSNKLTIGETSRDGVTLLSANSKSIVVLVDGKRYRYKKFSNKGTILADNVTLIRSPGSGGYWAKGRINGKDVTFLIDTGASCVVMNKDQAKAWRIKQGNKRIQISTATRKETAYQVTLDSVSVGDIELHNISAIITQHKYPPYPLLGMSFLSRVKINQENGQMILKYSAR